MTPKEKAEELFNKMYNNPYVQDFEAKRCALVAVDEILFQYTTLNSDLVNWLYKGEKVVYWQEVRKEIEKL